MEQQLAELVMWEQVRQDCKYPKEDNNNGLIYGLYFIDDFNEDDLGSGEVIDVEWFETDEERYKVIKENNLKIINE
tara:strand:- start:51 stop:278 length:228 start_codon:yes stop_codon:yes gene_type:complete